MINTIAEAKEHLKENWEKGVDCPACGQHVQLYRYPLFATSAYALIELYKLTINNYPEEYFHVNKFAEAKAGKIRSPHFAELRFWGLVQAMDKKTKEKNSSGYWAITEKGKRFVERSLKVPKYIKIYNNKFVGHEGDEISITDALGNKFNYADLIQGSVDKV